MSGYDYVVVGGGSAGCVVAARLSEDPEVSVLLLEGGGDERRPDVETPEAWPGLLGGDADWGYLTIEQPGTGHVTPAHRGKVLGGSGSINVMAHLRGHRLDFEEWVGAGASGWGYEDTLPYFKRSEDVPAGDPAYRGRGGPLHPRPIASPHPLTLAHVEAARLAGHEVVEDLNAAELMGASRHDLLIRDGRRESAATAYLRPAFERPNLTVETDAVARRLVVSGGGCTGVEYVRDGELRRAHGGEEIVLCAGAVDTPRLLLLSGIGPADELAELGLEVVHDSPEIGRNLQDHVMLAGIRVAAGRPLPPPSGNFAESTVFARTDPAQPRPELQLVQIQVDYHLPWQEPLDNSFTIGIGHMRPRSRGSIRLASADPEAPPLIDPAHLREAEDVDQLIAGIEAAHALTETGAFEAWGGRSETGDLLQLDRPALEQVVRDAASSFFHLCGTCRMGSDADAVVDSELRLNGIAGVRIADASVMPRIISCNTNAATVMIGEKAADLLLDRPRAAAVDPAAAGSRG